MIAAGGLDEVRRLAELKLAPELPVTRALGVRPLMAHLDGLLPLEAAIAAAKVETRRYAKRQLTWARSNMIAWSRYKTQ
jgi:tRNA dimethylallyltransferase